MGWKELLKPNAVKVALFLLLTLIAFLVVALVFHPETVRYWALLSIMIPAYVASALVYQPVHNHPRLLRVVKWIVFTPIGFVVLVSMISQFAPDKPPKDFLITRNFVDLGSFDRFSGARVRYSLVAL